MCSHVYCLSPPILLPNHCFSCSTCVFLITPVCLPIYPPGVCSPVLIRCLTSCVYVECTQLSGFCSSLFYFIIKKTHLPEFDSSPSSLQLIPDTGSKDQVFYSNFCSKTCLSKFSTIVAHYDKTVNEKHNHKTKVDPNIEILTLMSFQTKNKVSSGLLHCVFLLITAINYKMIIRSKVTGKDDKL